MNTIKKYPKALIATHWITLVLLIAVFLRGKSLEHLDFTAENMNAFRSHAIPGMLLFLLTLVRMLVKNKHKNKLPKEIEYYSTGHRILVRTVNKLIYVFLIVTPLIGFIMIYKTGALSYDFGGPFPTGAHFNDTLEVAHKIGVFSLLSMVVLHVLGVVLYKFKKGENLVKRMCHFIN